MLPFFCKYLQFYDSITAEYPIPSISMCPSIFLIVYINIETYFLQLSFQAIDIFITVLFYCLFKPLSGSLIERKACLYSISMTSAKIKKI